MPKRTKADKRREIEKALQEKARLAEEKTKVDSELVEDEEIEDDGVEYGNFDENIEKYEESKDADEDSA